MQTLPKIKYEFVITKVRSLTWDHHFHLYYYYYYYNNFRNYNRPFHSFIIYI